MSSMTTDKRAILGMIASGAISVEQGQAMLRAGAGAGAAAAAAAPVSATESASAMATGLVPSTAHVTAQPGAAAPAVANAAALPRIAVIGMAGRFAGARDKETFWRNLADGRETLTEAAHSRWAGVPGLPADARIGLLEGIELFDPLFFRISPKEAELMDPEHRLFLQEAWSALEDAGYAPGSLDQHRVGVFAGCGTGDYLTLLNESGVPPESATLTGNMSALLAARLAYCLNLRGPVLAVHTACSSSLVAIHLACESLRHGDCELALAGGVALISSAVPYLALSHSDMLSPDGRCRAFDDGANGFVPAEGAAALLLKPLEAALRDGDHVYGVIAGSAINHDGRTNGITAPSALAQGALEIDLYTRFGIDPSGISYIEAHGTGTKLGDPIEVAALTGAFRHFTDRSGFCSIGSVKSNIGHCMAASGAAGLMKVLLALRHELLPASLFVERENRHIQFEGSPFMVNKVRRAWPSTPAQPRRAAVSSFGLSGTNCHLVVEEAPARAALAPHGAQPQVIVLTARLAVVAGDAAAARAELARYAREGTPSATLFCGVLEEGAAGAAVPARGAGAEALAAAWVGGAPLDWAAINGGGAWRRVPLPTYPFAELRCWAPDKAPTRAPAPARLQQLHPLIDRVLPSLNETRFSTTLTGSAPWLAGHVIGGLKTLPGVATLELVRAGATLAAGRPVRVLTDVVWGRPLTVGEAPVELQLRLLPQPDGLAFETSTGDAEGTRRVHAQGRIASAATAPHEDTPAALAAIRARCPLRSGADEIYRRLAAFGLQYGPAFRYLSEAWRGDGELLGVLARPAAAQDDDEGWMLPPGMMDAALHGIIVLSDDGDDGDKDGYLPYSLGRIEIFAPLPARCLAHVRRLADDAGGRRFAVRLFDEAGNTLVLLDDFVMRRVAAPDALVYCRPLWTAAPAPTGVSGQVLLLDADAERAALLRQAHGWQLAHAPADGGALTLRALAEAGQAACLAALCDGSGRAPDHLIVVEADGDEADDLTGASAARLGATLAALSTVVAALGARPGGWSGRLQFVLHGGAADRRGGRASVSPLLAGVRAFLQTLALEYPALTVSTLLVEHEADVVEALAAEGAPTHVLRLAAGRLQRTLAPWTPDPATPPTALVPGALYLITGGAGGLGLIFAEHLVRTAAARVVLCGRSAPDAQSAARIASLREAGATVVFRQVDVNDAAALARLVEDTVAEHGPLHGVLHAAGLLRDGLARTLAAHDLAAVLAPKLDGLVNLDLATRAQPLAWFVAFSSISALQGNRGQAAYAAANAAMESLVEARARLRDTGARSGSSLAIAWPLWRDGGMRVSAETAARLSGAAGLAPLATDAGLQAFARMLAGAASPLAVLAGNRRQIERGLGWGTDLAAPAAAASDAGSAVLADLTKIAAALLAVDPAELDARVDLGDFGFDSISLTDLAAHLNVHFGLSLAPTLFYQHPTLGALAAALCGAHGALLQAHYAGNAQPTPQALPAPSAAESGADTPAGLDLARPASQTTAPTGTQTVGPNRSPSSA